MSWWRADEEEERFENEHAEFMNCAQDIYDISRMIGVRSWRAACSVALRLSVWRGGVWESRSDSECACRSQVFHRRRRRSCSMNEHSTLVATPHCLSNIHQSQQTSRHSWKSTSIWDLRTDICARCSTLCLLALCGAARRAGGRRCECGGRRDDVERLLVARLRLIQRRRRGRVGAVRQRGGHKRHAAASARRRERVEVVRGGGGSGDVRVRFIRVVHREAAERTADAVAGCNANVRQRPAGPRVVWSKQVTKRVRNVFIASIAKRINCKKRDSRLVRTQAIEDADVLRFINAVIKVHVTNFEKHVPSEETVATGLMLRTDALDLCKRSLS